MGVEVCLNPALGCLEYGRTVLAWAAKLAPVWVEEEVDRLFSWKRYMVKFWKRWSSCCPCFSEPRCFWQCVESARELLPASHAWLALRQLWCQAIYLPAFSFPRMQSRWMLSSSWLSGFGPPTLSWFLLSLLHPCVSFYLATGSFLKLEVKFTCDPCVVALWLHEFSVFYLCAENGNNNVLSFLQVEYTCRIYHVLQRPCSTSIITSGSLWFLLKDVAIISFDLRDCFFGHSLYFGCCLT